MRSGSRPASPPTTRCVPRRPVPTYDPDLPLSFPDQLPRRVLLPARQRQGAGERCGEPAGRDQPRGRLRHRSRPSAGDQMVFARVRIKDVNVPQRHHLADHPPVRRGRDHRGRRQEVRASTRRCDIGLAPGNFSGALAGRVGPFLKWDPSVAPAAPAGYIGDPGVLHKVVGSPYDTNYVKVEQKNADGSWSLVGQWDDQFSLQGRLAVNSGVDVDAATFTGDDNGGFVDVYASSDAAQSIVVSANATLGTPATPMREVDGRYYARIAVDTKIPAGTQLEVVNTGDKPVAKKLAPITDQVAVTVRDVRRRQRRPDHPGHVQRPRVRCRRTCSQRRRVRSTGQRAGDVQHDGSAGRGEGDLERRWLGLLDADDVGRGLRQRSLPWPSSSRRSPCRSGDPVPLDGAASIGDDHGLRLGDRRRHRDPGPGQPGRWPPGLPTLSTRPRRSR